MCSGFLQVSGLFCSGLFHSGLFRLGLFRSGLFRSGMLHTGQLRGALGQLLDATVPNTKTHIKDVARNLPQFVDVRLQSGKVGQEVKVGVQVLGQQLLRHGRRVLKSTLSNFFCCGKNKLERLSLACFFQDSLTGGNNNFIEYSAHFYTLKMMLKYSLRTIHGRYLRKSLRWLLC